MQPEALAGDAPSLLIVDDSAVMRAMIKRAASLSGRAT